MILDNCQSSHVWVTSIEAPSLGGQTLSIICLCQQVVTVFRYLTQAGRHVVRTRFDASLRWKKTVIYGGLVFQKLHQVEMAYLFIYLFCLLLSFTVIFIRARNASFISYSSVSISILCLPYEFVLSTLLPIVENHFKQLPISAHLRDQMQPELFSKTAEIPNIFNLWKNCKF